MSLHEGDWTLHIAIDSCSDVTWGYTFPETRRNLAHLVRSHLLQLRQHAEHRYNSSVFFEFQSLCEEHPTLIEEALQAIRDRRYCVSPFLCNTLWGSQSIEAIWRSLWHARQLEKEANVRLFEIGQHIELPSVPIGALEVLAACSLRAINKPFLAYEGAMAEVECPIRYLQRLPSGRSIVVHMDPFACRTAGYWHGRHLTETREMFEPWIRHYQGSGHQNVLASGMHLDTLANSGDEAGTLAERVRIANQWSNSVSVRMTTYNEFAIAADLEPDPLPEFNGNYGCSWEAWPVSLADIVSQARDVERDLIAAEAAVALASQAKPELTEAFRFQNSRTHWLLAMIGDHAWNGTTVENRRENARLRQDWVNELRTRVDALWEMSGNPRPSRPTRTGAPGLDALAPLGLSLHLSNQPELGTVKWSTESGFDGEVGLLRVRVLREAGSEPDSLVLEIRDADPEQVWLETGGAMLCPMTDLSPGAERRWHAFQHLAVVQHPESPLWIASRDAFLWRVDRGGIQLFGNDINPSEISLDQYGTTEFSFEFAFRRGNPRATLAEAVNWARCQFGGQVSPSDALAWDPSRLCVTSLRPADEGPPGAVTVRFWELSGDSHPVMFRSEYWNSAQAVDLLERTFGPSVKDSLAVPAYPFGVGAARLSRL